MVAAKREMPAAASFSLVEKSSGAGGKRRWNAYQISKLWYNADFDHAFEIIVPGLQHATIILYDGILI